MKTLKSAKIEKSKSHSVDTSTDDLCQNITTDQNSDQRTSN